MPTMIDWRDEVDLVDDEIRLILAHKWSDRSINTPVHKAVYWVSRRHRHLNQPELTQVAFDAFVKVAEMSKERFVYGQRLWQVAFTHFPPLDGFFGCNISSPLTISKNLACQMLANYDIARRERRIGLERERFDHFKAFLARVLANRSSGVVKDVTKDGHNQVGRLSTRCGSSQAMSVCAQLWRTKEARNLAVNDRKLLLRGSGKIRKYVSRLDRYRVSHHGDHRGGRSMNILYRASARALIY